MPKQPKIKLPSLKAMGNAVVKYRAARAAGTIGKSATMEALLPFFGKKGQVLKRETRYNTQRERLKEAVKNAQQRYGKTPGVASFKRGAAKKAAETKKAAESFARKEAPKTKQGEADKRFTKVARETANKFLNAAEVFASDTYDQLKSGAYGIGSDVVIAMAESGLSPEEIEEYLKQIKETFDDIPEEAQGLASNDDFWKAVKELTDIIREDGQLDYKEVFTVYIRDDPDPEDFRAVLENYVSYEGDKTKSFTEMWSNLKDLSEPGNKKTFEELMTGQKTEDQGGEENA